jgi:hypothetical protein
VAIHSTIRDVFSHFQCLNLRFLMEDLRSGRAARRGWSSGNLLCPIAHGLPHGRDVRQLNALGQSLDLVYGCGYAASRLGASTDAVLRFVRYWDEEVLVAEKLLRQLEELWYERLADAEAVQQVICRSVARPGQIRRLLSGIGSGVSGL